MGKVQVKTSVFAESCIPPLASGEYMLNIKQHSTLLGNSESVEQKLFVEGIRFSFGPEDVSAVYPPDQMRGSFGESLPHIVFQRKTIPWERSEEKQKIDSAGPSMQTPWLALLHLWEDEIVEIKSDKVTEVIDDAAVFFPYLDMRDEEKEVLCNYIDVKTSLFREVFPAHEDLAYLCHARKVEPILKVDNGSAAQEEWRSVLISARLPEVSDAGRKNRIYVVSLEGFDNYTTNTAIDKYNSVRLIVLHYWDFYAETKKYHFKEICKNLSSGLLVFPGQPNKSIMPLLENGFVPMIHHVRNGEKTVSFYRSPLAPLIIKKQPATETASADKHYQYDPEIGMFDISYAYAWQIGRLIALNNKSTAIKIMKLRGKNRQTVHRKKLKSQLDRNFLLDSPGNDSNESVGLSLLDLLNERLGKII